MYTFGFIDDVIFAHTNERNRRGKKAYTQSDSTEGSIDLTPQHILKLTHQEAAPDRAPSLISATALSSHYLVVFAQLRVGVMYFDVFWSACSLSVV